MIAYERGRINLPSQLSARNLPDARLSVITASELLHGVARATDVAIQAKRTKFVEDALAKFPIVMIDLDTARLHAQLWADLDRAGMPIGRHDAWLAATCMRHGMTMLTANEREFRRVPGLVVENWLSS